MPGVGAIGAFRMSAKHNGNGRHALKPVLVNAKKASKPNPAPAINSLSDLNHLHAQEHEKRMLLSNERITVLKQRLGVTANLGESDFVRTQVLRFLLDGLRDVDTECGYPIWLTPDHYRAMYDREGIAKRVVECEPEETWGMDPLVYESEDEDEESDFEEAWDKFQQDYDIWHYLFRIDVLSGIGQFGVLLFGLNDGKNMNEPVDGMNDDGTFDPPEGREIIYLRPFDETVIFVKTREVDIKSDRYGLPTMYTIQFRDYPNWGVQAGEIIARDIHWHRVLHVADNRKMSEVYGVPRMQPVWNRLYDLRKTYAASGEGFWKSAFPTTVFEVNPELADQGLQLDTETLKDEMDKVMKGLQRYYAVTGVSAKNLPGQVSDPTPFVESQLKSIAISKGIPYRILFGSEEAKLAGTQDDRHWNKRLSKRQTKYVNPLIIRPFIDRMIAFGVLPKPKSDNYIIDWPDLNAPTDQDKATVALSQTQALAAYISGNVSQLIGPQQFLTQVMKFSADEAKAILEDAQDFNEQNENQDEDPNEEEGIGNEGGIGDPTQPDQGNALDQQNLGRSTTTRPGVKQVDAQWVQQPSLNKEGENRRPFPLVTRVRRLRR
jgi:uncharacterized protein